MRWLREKETRKMTVVHSPCNETSKHQHLEAAGLGFGRQYKLSIEFIDTKREDGRISSLSIDCNQDMFQGVERNE
jgi:hypothetical protein